MNEKIQKFGLIEIIYLIRISALWGRIPCFLTLRPLGAHRWGWRQWLPA